MWDYLNFHTLESNTMSAAFSKCSTELIPSRLVNLPKLVSVLQKYGWNCQQKVLNGPCIIVTVDTAEYAIEFLEPAQLLTVSTGVSLPPGPVSKQTLRLLAWLNETSLGPRFYFYDYGPDEPMVVATCEVHCLPVLVVEQLLGALRLLAREMELHGCQFNSADHLLPWNQI